MTALTMEKSWKYIASASLKPSFTTIDCRLDTPHDAQEAYSTKMPTKWSVEWTPSSHIDMPPEYRTFLEASNSCLGICSVIQALYPNLNCSINLEHVGNGIVKNIQINIGR